MESKAPITILMADDDPDDCFLVQEALKESGLDHRLYFVENGEELMDYLHHRGKYADPAQSPRPDLILLDINMPRKTGFEALREIRGDSHLEDIPVVIFATSEDDEARVEKEKSGACSFVAKPSSFGDLVALIRDNIRDWLAKCP